MIAPGNHNDLNSLRDAPPVRYRWCGIGSFISAIMMFPPEWDAHLRLLLEEKLSSEARLMWCAVGSALIDELRRNRSTVTPHPPQCALLKHLLLKEKAFGQ